jgi:signal transduction histidine kinase
MRDRVHAVGGSLSLSPRPGRGTRLSAFLPLVPAGAGVLETQA